jgi:AcrR family transcriptional regulator
MSKRESEVRKRILDTATRLFYGPGYNVTGINQIIEEAGVVKRSLYQHFESKTDLLMTYLDFFQEYWYTTLKPYLEAFPEPKDKVLALFEFRIFYQEKHLFPGCPFAKINAEIGFDNAVVNLRVREGKNVFRAFIFHLVKNAGHQSLFTDDELTEMIFLLIEGALSSTAIYKSTSDLKQAKLLVRKLL